MIKTRIEDHKEFFDSAYNSLNIVFQYDHNREDSDAEIIMFFFEEQQFDINKVVRIGDIIAAKVILLGRKYADWDFEKTRKIIKETYG